MLRIQCGGRYYELKCDVARTTQHQTPLFLTFQIIPIIDALFSTWMDALLSTNTDFIWSKLMKIKKNHRIRIRHSCDVKFNLCNHNKMGCCVLFSLFQSFSRSHSLFLLLSTATTSPPFVFHILLYYTYFAFIALIILIG